MRNTEDLQVTFRENVHNESPSRNGPNFKESNCAHSYDDGDNSSFIRNEPDEKFSISKLPKTNVEILPEEIGFINVNSAISTNIAETNQEISINKEYFKDNDVPTSISPIVDMNITKLYQDTVHIEASPANTIKSSVATRSTDNSLNFSLNEADSNQDISNTEVLTSSPNESSTVIQDAFISKENSPSADLNNTDSNRDTCNTEPHTSGFNELSTCIQDAAAPLANSPTTDPINTDINQDTYNNELSASIISKLSTVIQDIASSVANSPPFHENNTNSNRAINKNAKSAGGLNESTSAAPDKSNTHFNQDEPHTIEHTVSSNEKDSIIVNTSTSVNKQDTNNTTISISTNYSSKTEELPIETVESSFPLIDINSTATEPMASTENTISLEEPESEQPVAMTELKKSPASHRRGRPRKTETTHKPSVNKKNVAVGLAVDLVEDSVTIEGLGSLARKSASKAAPISKPTPVEIEPLVRSSRPRRKSRKVIENESIAIAKDPPVNAESSLDNTQEIIIVDDTNGSNKSNENIDVATVVTPVKPNRRRHTKKSIVEDNIDKSLESTDSTVVKNTHPANPKRKYTRRATVVDNIAVDNTGNTYIVHNSAVDNTVADDNSASPETKRVTKRRTTSKGCVPTKIVDEENVVLVAKRGRKKASVVKEVKLKEAEPSEAKEEILEETKTRKRKYSRVNEKALPVQPEEPVVAGRGSRRKTAITINYAEVIKDPAAYIEDQLPNPKRAKKANIANETSTTTTPTRKSASSSKKVINIADEVKETEVASTSSSLTNRKVDQKSLDYLLHNRNSYLTNGRIIDQIAVWLSHLNDTDKEMLKNLLPEVDQKEFSELRMNSHFSERFANWQELLLLGGFDNDNEDSENHVEKPEDEGFKDDNYESYWGEKWFKEKT